MIEPWISEKAYQESGRTRECETVEAIRRLGAGNSDDHLTEIHHREVQVFETWLKQYFASDPATTADALANWAKPDIDLSSWTRGPLTGLLGSKTVGVCWYRREIDVPASWAGRPMMLHVDAINDCDETFFDGEKIGSTSYDVPQYWAAPRDYAIPAKFVVPGRHVIAVRVMNHFMEGGITGKVWLSSEEAVDPISLNEGSWAERREFVADIRKIGVRPTVPGNELYPRESQQTPTTLYNAMIHPFTVLNVRGFIWYQGCSNTGAPEDYATLQPLMIDCWRKAWGNSEAAFIITQLSAFQQHSPESRLPDDFWKNLEPEEFGYQKLREVQDAMLTYPNTGVAVTIDIGDHSDIHPHNKKDVAFRLAQEAERLCYGNTGITAGPRYQAKTIESGRIRISFTHVGGGLVAKGGTIGPHSFAIAGDDGKFVWADAKIDGDDVVVWSSSVPNPVNVRYAWAMFPPQANLYNVEGFPMYPFRTDAPR